MYELKIEQIAKQRPGDDIGNRWEKHHEYYPDLESVIGVLDDMYGKLPFREGNEVYRDTEEGGEHIGYVYSFWEHQDDRSKPWGSKYWAQDWVTVMYVEKRSAIRELEMKNTG